MEYLIRFVQDSSTGLLDKGINTVNKRIISSFMTKYWLLVFTIAVGLAFGLFKPTFFKVDNLLNVLSSACLAGVAGIGLTCVMATGEIDFSGGVEVTAGATFMSILISNGIVENYLLAVAITIVLCLIFGLFNGFLNVKAGIPSFIATMGSSFALKGVLKWATNGAGIKGLSLKCPEYTFLGQGYLFGVIPMPLVVLLIVSVIAIVFTERTKQGKYLYAVGVNPTACRFIGIDSNRCKFIGFLLSAGLCGLCGIMQGSMVNGSTTSLGDNMMTQAITVLMLGATFMRVGVYNVLGTIVGAVLLSELLTGLTMMGASSIVRNFVEGAILMIGVSVVCIIKTRSNKSVG